MLIAHRGLVKKGVIENTLPAFLGAIKSNKYAGFELDIYTSLDGIFVVHHDPLLDGKFIWKCLCSCNCRSDAWCAFEVNGIRGA